MPDFKSYPTPVNEGARLASLEALGVLDAAPDPALDHITALLRDLYGCETALVTLVADARQWFYSRIGLDIDETPKDMSLCAHVVAEAAPLVITDLHANPRFKTHPLIRAEFPLRFYAGVPLVLENGFVIGALCVIDPEPRDAPDPMLLDHHIRLAKTASIIIERTAHAGGGDTETLDHAKNAAQTQFLDLVSHELRTPLNGITGLQEVLGELIDLSDPDLNDIFEAMAASTQHLVSVIENILIFTDAESGAIRANRKTVPLAHLIDTSRHSIDVLARRRARPLNIAQCDPALTVTLDPTLITTALDCLLLNALAHGDGEISLSHTLDSDGTLTLDVLDSGAGIAPDLLDDALKPFCVAADPMTRKNDGVGLGLPLARKFSELHGGTLRFLNGKKGFHVRITLPKTQVAAEAFHGVPHAHGTVNDAGQARRAAF